MWSFAVQGMLLALLWHALLFGLAYGLNRKNWPEQWLINLFCISSVLSISFYMGPFWPLSGLCALLLILLSYRLWRSGGSFGITKALCEAWISSWRRELIRLQWPEALCFFLAIFVLILDGFYAAVPFYRPDQWNYHLLIPGLIVNSDSGLMQYPRFFDHIFFSGTYDYFFIPLRLMTRDDLVFQSCVNFFNWFSLAMLLPAVIVRLPGMRSSERGLPRIVALSGGILILFALPSRDMIANAKVEPILLLTSMVVLGGMFRLLRGELARSHAFVFALLLTAPVGNKLTWLHFLLPLVVVWLLDTVRKPDRGFSLLYFCGGSLAGLLLAIPFFIKNHLFFGNILHPLQTLFFSSQGWLPAHEQYWARVAGKATDSLSYVRILWKLPWQLCKELRYFLIPWVAGLFCLRYFLSQRCLAEDQRFFLVRILWLTVLAILLWPLLYRHDIYPRFYYPLLSLPLLAMLLCLRDLFGRKYVLFLLLFPVFVASQAEVKLRKLTQALCQDAETFYAEMTGPGHFRNDMVFINQHYREHMPNRHDTERIKGNVVLADEIQGYFLDGLLLRWDSPDFFMILNQWRPEDPTLGSCLWAFLQDHGVRYLHAGARHFAQWPGVWQDIIASGIPSDYSDRIRVLPEDVIAAGIKNCHQRTDRKTVREQVMSSYRLDYSDEEHDETHIRIFY